MKKYPNVGEPVRVPNETKVYRVTNVNEGGEIIFSDGVGQWRKAHAHNLITIHQKWITIYVIQQHYGGQYGWEDVTEEESRKAGIQRYRDYRNNTSYPTRLIRRRERNELYQGE